MKVNAEDIIDKAVLRLQKRIKTLEYGIQCAYCKGDARAQDVRLDSFRKRLEGIGDIEKGRVILDKDLQIAIINNSNRNGRDPTDPLRDPFPPNS